MRANPYMHRIGKRAASAMRIRNTYTRQYGIQYYLIVEGDADEHFFENILDCDKCKVVNLDGKENVKDYIKEQNQAHKKGYLGIVDADFEHITRYEEKPDNIILTDVHDIEMLILSSKPNMRRIYSEMTDNIIIKDYERKHSKSFIDSIIDAAYEIGLLKLVLKRPHYGIDMKDIPYSDIIYDNFNVDINKLITRIKGKNFTEFEILDELDVEKGKEYDKYQVTCGHDVTKILAISFMSTENDGLGYGNQRRVSNDTIEELLRVIYDYKHFCITKMFAEIIDWENKNRIKILDRTVIQVAS